MVEESSSPGGLPFERVVLVLQGGGALGAYQAGVYAALAETDVQLDWISGISIGAINAALIVGNKPALRVAKLREFWEMVTQPVTGLAGPSWFANLPWGESESMRALTSRMEAATNMLYGARNFFSPRPLPPVSLPADSPAGASYYDISPLEATLQKLVDFDLINQQPTRLSVGAANIRTGEPLYFDSLDRKIRAEHIMASGSLPPSFPPVEVDGEYYWDGGLISNSALQFVVNSKPRYSALVFQVDLWDPNGEVPLDITAANLRATEIHSASRINVSLDEFRHQQRVRLTLRKLLDKVPEGYRNAPEIALLAEEAHVQRAVLVRLRYQAKKHEGASKIFNFSRAAMEHHWRAGYEDTRTALRERAIFELPDDAEAVRIFDVHSGWIG